MIFLAKAFDVLLDLQGLVNSDVYWSPASPLWSGVKVLDWGWNAQCIQGVFLSAHQELSSPPVVRLLYHWGVCSVSGHMCYPAFNFEADSSGFALVFAVLHSGSSVFSVVIILTLFDNFWASLCMSHAVASCFFGLVQFLYFTVAPFSLKVI